MTVQQGTLGVGWVCTTSRDETLACLKDPVRCCRGALRYVVISAGQSIYLPCGLTYFLYRPFTMDIPTFVLGGYLLSYSDVDRWLQTLKDQIRFPRIVDGLDQDGQFDVVDAVCTILRAQNAEDISLIASLEAHLCDLQKLVK
jgi:hypothetical protein